jgi:hypothetical protein
MKKLILTLFVFAAGITLSQAQLLTFRATTGDIDMDKILTDIHNRAIKDLSNFKATVDASFGIGIPKIEASLKLLPPGDVFMAAQIASTINKPFETVVKTYQANKTKGWGVIAKEMGIKPGSPEFHAMKKSMKSKGAGDKGSGNASAGPGNSGAKGNNGKGKKK